MSQLKESEHLKIPFKEIEKATNNFETCIGKGGYGRVYRGELFIYGKLTTVAVKRLYEQFGQGSKEFLTEIALLSGQKHPNLISLLGYCEEGKEKIIIYEYVERGSLDQYLTPHNTTHVLTWPERLKICVDIARGLEHLHNHVGKHQTIIHRDIKSANILVDHNWVAKISDLGLSKLSLSGLNRSAIISHACGTPGYCEPEYMTTGIVKKESDVYSFGVVLLEILCGRLCTIRDDHSLFLLDYYQMKKLEEIIDPRLRKQMSSYSMNKFLSIAYGCLHKDRGQRFPMDLVVKELEESLKIELSLTHGDGMNPNLISSDGLQERSPNSSFAMLLRRRTNVGKIFDIFDLNRDGGLSREELVAFLVVTKANDEHGPEQISAYVDEVLCMYDIYLDDKKGLTYHGLLQYYDDGHGDLDCDFVQLVSDSSSEDSDSSRRHKLITIFQKHNHDLSLLKLVLDSKPSDDDEAAIWFGSPETLVMIKPLTNKPILLWLAITLSILLITTILVKLNFSWFVFLVLSNSIRAFMNKRKKKMMNALK